MHGQAPDQRSSSRSCGDSRATFRRWRAVFRSVRTFFFCGPVGHFALWKAPRYFSDSIACPLVTARRNQIREGIGVIAIVEAPRKFVHVQRQVVFADFVIAADDSAFEETPESFDAVCVSGADDVLASTVPDDAMRQRISEQPVSRMFVGRDQLHVLGNGLPHESVQCRGIGVLDNFRDDHSLAADRADDGDFAFSAGQRGLLAVLRVHVVRFAADESLVYFHDAIQRKRIAFHRSAPAMTDVPSGSPVGSRPFAEDDAPDLERAKALLCGPHQVADLKPNPQRDFCILKDRVSGHAESIAGASATILVAAGPAERSLERIDSLFPFASRTADAIRPTLGDNVGFAIFIGRECSVELFVSHHAQNFSEDRGDCQ
jgi:hypothetical protein